MRTATIKLEGEERLLCFSTGVVEKACERFGSLDAYFKAMEKGDQAGQMKTVIWSLAAMMDAGDRYAKRKGIPNPAPLTEDDIRELCDVTELMGLQSKIAETISNGSARTVEAEPPKNAGATPEPEAGTPAP